MISLKNTLLLDFGYVYDYNLGGYHNIETNDFIAMKEVDEADIYRIWHLITNPTGARTHEGSEEKA